MLKLALGTVLELKLKLKHWTKANKCGTILKVIFIKERAEYEINI